jgi:hypothetical protein
MDRLRVIVCGLIVLVILSVAGIAWAQTSPGYDNRWHVLGAGGSEGMSSEYHTVHSTLGQFAIGPAASGRTSVGSGYWYGIRSSAAYRIYLPIIEHITAAR